MQQIAPLIDGSVPNLPREPRVYGLVIIYLFYCKQLLGVVELLLQSVVVRHFEADLLGSCGDKCNFMHESLLQWWNKDNKKIFKDCINFLTLKPLQKRECEEVYVQYTSFESLLDYFVKGPKLQYIL